MFDGFYSHDPVDGQHEGQIVGGQADGLQDDGDGDDASRWDARRAHARGRGRHPGNDVEIVTTTGRRAERQPNSQDGEDLPAVQLDVVELSDEDGGDALEDGGAVHVHRGPDGEDEAADALVHTVVLLHALYHGGKRRGAGDRKRHSFVSVRRSGAKADR